MNTELFAAKNLPFLVAMMSKRPRGRCGVRPLVIAGCFSPGIALD
jgi:hypothetical protein